MTQKLWTYLWGTCPSWGLREGGDSPESKVSTRQPAVWEQKRAVIVLLLRELGPCNLMNYPSLPYRHFLCKEQDDSLIIQTPALWVAQEENCTFFLCNSLSFSRLHRMFVLVITSFSSILAYTIDCCLFPNDAKGGTSMTPVKWSMNLNWGLIFTPRQLSQWSKSNERDKNVSRCIILTYLFTKVG